MYEVKSKKYNTLSIIDVEKEEFEQTLASSYICRKVKHKFFNIECYCIDETGQGDK